MQEKRSRMWDRRTPYGRWLRPPAGLLIAFPKPSGISHSASALVR